MALQTLIGFQHLIGLFLLRLLVLHLRKLVNNMNVRSVNTSGKLYFLSIICLILCLFMDKIQYFIIVERLNSEDIADTKYSDKY